MLVSADYSQVELRILAHYSGDASLIEAFRAGEDIHRRTAAEVWGTTPAEVSAERRARAKAVNFGIIYGLSSFGLANQLGIATGEAQETIETYFRRYGGVRRFIDETIAAAQSDGFVTTWMGRRRRLPDLRSRNRTLRQAAERMAVNTVKEEIRPTWKLPAQIPFLGGEAPNPFAEKEIVQSPLLDKVDPRVFLPATANLLALGVFLAGGSALMPQLRSAVSALSFVADVRGDVADSARSVEVATTTVRVLWRTLFAPVVPWAFALVTLMGAACAVFGTALNHLVFGRAFR